MTEIESWRELADDEIEFVMRRLPTADWGWGSLHNGRRPELPYPSDFECQ
jgi:hypothetical protein